MNDFHIKPSVSWLACVMDFFLSLGTVWPRGATAAGTKETAGSHGAQQTPPQLPGEYYVQKHVYTQCDTEWGFHCYYFELCCCVNWSDYCSVPLQYDPHLGMNWMSPWPSAVNYAAFSPLVAGLEEGMLLNNNHSSVKFTGMLDALLS